MKYLVKVNTCYEGCEQIYRIETDNIENVSSLAKDIAYDNFIESGSYDALVEDYEGVLVEDQLYDLIEESYWYSIDEFKGTNNEWEMYEDL